MITVTGTPESQMSLKDVQKQVPSRLLRLLLRLASLPRGKHIIVYNVGDGDVSWHVSEFGKLER